MGKIWVATTTANVFCLVLGYRFFVNWYVANRKWETSHCQDSCMIWRRLIRSPYRVRKKFSHWDSRLIYRLYRQYTLILSVIFNTLKVKRYTELSLKYENRFLLLFFQGKFRLSKITVCTFGLISKVSHILKN